ncbi:hypothetical protein UY3_03393 [Chelonia mydas]|uniref:Uncharacterized protein n=1 Tax=Chelonia mydas TaxID=8469 RepID=M7BND2_CHEMY|nr:hypothetical protein UY3_03393 [Chelonia mydas]
MNSAIPGTDSQLRLDIITKEEQKKIVLVDVTPPLRTGPRPSTMPELKSFMQKRRYLLVGASTACTEAALLECGRGRHNGDDWMWKLPYVHDPGAGTWEEFCLHEMPSARADGGEDLRFGDAGGKSD